MVKRNRISEKSERRQRRTFESKTAEKKEKMWRKKFVGGAAEAHPAAVYASARAELVHPHPLQRPGPRLHYHERPEDTGGQNSVKTNLIGRMFRPILGLLLRSSFLLLFCQYFTDFDNYWIFCCGCFFSVFNFYSNKWRIFSPFICCLKYFTGSVSLQRKISIIF